MKVGRCKTALVAAMATAMLATSSVWPLMALAQNTRGIMMYEDVNTGAFYSKPGRGRVAVGRLILGGTEEAAPSAATVQEQIQKEVKKHDDELRAEFLANQQTMMQKNAQLSQQVSEMKPAWTDYMDNFKNKFRLGTLVYADWRMYSHTTFQPQELTQINNPGIGNNWFNSFDISRAYLNFFFSPTDDWTARVTPNIYRQDIAASNQSVGPNGTYPAVTNDLAFRLKYAYLQYNKLFDKLGITPMKGDTITLGQEPNPLVDWEEQMYGFRYVNLTPWNYLSLSSTQQGVSVQGPIKFNELQYVDYDAGVYNNSSFHAFEQTNTKQAMGRISFYPFGAKWKYDGLGFTGFYDYGYGNVTADTNTGIPASPSPLYNAPKAHFSRIAGLVHYNTEWWGLAFEYDQGHNAFTSGNMFSAVLPTGKYSNNALLATALMNNGRAVEQGYDVFGHLHIPETPCTLFGMFQWFEPNTHVDVNPFDFKRWIAGVSYQYNEFLRFSISTQNMLYYHNDFAFSEAYANKFAPEFAKAGTKTVPNAVFRDGHSLFLNLEFNY